MPFISPIKRQQVDKDFRFAEDKGDICYLIYKELIKEFNEDPRWRTIHNIYKTKIVDTTWLFKFKENKKYVWQDMITALHLAWQVFFMMKVMPYELEKQRKNGDIS